MTTRARLGELLLASGTCTKEQLREAWEQKVLYGDRLGTNLLALGHVDEAALARALGTQHGVHAGHGTVLRPDKDAIKRVPRNVAEKRCVVPHHVAGRALYLLMRDPHDAVAIDEAQFASGMKVVPVVVAEARLWQLLETHYGARLTLRPLALDAPVRRGKRGHGFAEAERTNPALGPELTSEDDFQRLYAGIHGNQPTSASGDLEDITGTFGMGGESSGPVRPPTAPAAAVAASVPLPVEVAPPPVEPAPIATGPAADWRERVEQTNPMLAPPTRVEKPAPPSNEPEPFQLIDMADAEPTLTFPERQQTLDFHVEVAEVLDETPLSFADASRVLKAAADRDAIARVVLRAVRSRFERACLLTVYPDRFVGWLGIGDGMGQDRMRDLVVPRSDRSVFGMVSESRSHYIGPLQKWPLHGAWVKATGRKIPRSLAVFPILVRGRAVNLLVVDNGHQQHVGTDLGEVLILAQQIAGTYESLLKSA